MSLSDVYNWQINMDFVSLSLAVGSLKGRKGKVNLGKLAIGDGGGLRRRLDAALCRNHSLGRVRPPASYRAQRNSW